MSTVAKAHPVLAERMARHGFADRPAHDVAQAAGLTGAIQAQDPLASRLGVRSRSSSTVESDVLLAIEPHRTVVRTWLMRATIHLAAAQDVRWLTALIGPSIARKFRKRWHDLGLTDDVLARTAAALPDILSNGPLTRGQIVGELAHRGIRIDTTDQAPTHVLLHATAVGLVCRAADSGRDPTFVLLDDWLPDAPVGPRGDDALAELARRYFGAFSPASGGDFTVWSGLPSSRAIGLIRDELTPVDIDGRRGFSLGEAQPRRGLRLLSAFDNYLVGYKDRSLLIDARRRPHVYVGGIIRPTVLLDGRVIGTWRLVPARGGSTVEVVAFDPLPRRVRADVEAEVADIGRFLDRPTTLVIPRT